MNTAAAAATAGCTACRARSQCLTPGLDAETLRRIESRLVTTRRKVPAGAALFRTGDRLGALYAIRTGSFKTQACTPRGREHVTAFRLPGDLLGLDAIATSRHGADAVALEDSEVCVIPADRLHDLALEVPALQAALHRAMSREIVRQKRALAQLGSMSSAQRVAAFLLDFSERLNADGDPPSSFALAMRRNEVSSHLGLEIETVCRTVAKLQAAGLIRVRQRVVRIVDRDGLAAILEGRHTLASGRRPAETRTPT